MIDSDTSLLTENAYSYDDYKKLEDQLAFANSEIIRIKALASEYYYKMLNYHADIEQLEQKQAPEMIALKEELTQLTELLIATKGETK